MGESTNSARLRFNIRFSSISISETETPHMPTPSLNDPDTFPSADILTAILCGAKPAWDAFTDYLDGHTPACSGEWRYYKDGGRWLFKVTRKKKTMCWVSVWDGMFKTTFYFPDRAEEPIRASGVDPKYVEQFITGKRYGKIRGVTVDIWNPNDIEATKILMGIKEELK